MIKFNLKDRVAIVTGGAQGFGLAITERFIESGATVVVDSLSLQYLAGSTIDYAEDLTGSKFIIKNPNATTTCGCGESFSI